MSFYFFISMIITSLLALFFALSYISSSGSVVDITRIIIQHNTGIFNSTSSFLHYSIYGTLKTLFYILSGSTFIFHPFATQFARVSKSLGYEKCQCIRAVDGQVLKRSHIATTLAHWVWYGFGVRFLHLNLSLSYNLGLIACLMEYRLYGT